MPFNSLRYLVFLPIVLAAYQCAGAKGRWMVLLAASFLFYAALDALYLLGALVLIAAATFAIGLALGRAKEDGRRRALLWAGVAVNLLILIGMKYLPFLLENARSLARVFGLALPFDALPVWATVGVSYFVFQALSYLFDLYLGAAEPEGHFGRFTLYLAFFPKLLQGPIERGGDLLPQLRDFAPLDYELVRSGLFLFFWGLFKKMVIADRLGLFADAVFGNVHAFAGPSLLLGVYAYAFQIYLDFSAYTDMALGSARLFGVRLTPNFNQPYLARSIADFWRRWHLTFSRWILDYLFKPLQLQWRDHRTWGTPLALLVTFLLSGLWHGASWNFIVWGGLHGVFLAGSIFYRPLQKRLHAAFGLKGSPVLPVIQIVVTFHLVCLTWVFFRAASLRDAWYVLAHLARRPLADPSLATLHDKVVTWAFLNQSSREFLLALAGLGLLGVVSGRKVQDPFGWLRARAWPARWALYYALAFGILFFGLFKTGTFLYYKF